MEILGIWRESVKASRKLATPKADGLAQNQKPQSAPPRKEMQNADWQGPRPLAMDQFCKRKTRKQAGNI